MWIKKEINLIFQTFGISFIKYFTGFDSLVWLDKKTVHPSSIKEWRSANRSWLLPIKCSTLRDSHNDLGACIFSQLWHFYLAAMLFYQHSVSQRDAWLQISSIIHSIMCAVSHRPFRELTWPSEKKARKAKSNKVLVIICRNLGVLEMAQSTQSWCEAHLW